MEKTVLSTVSVNNEIAVQSPSKALKLSLVTLGVMLAFNSGLALANKDIDVSKENVKLGKNVQTIGNLTPGTNHKAILIGNNTKAAESSVAVGDQANASGVRATAIGSESSATADWAIALGSRSKALGKESIAVGQESQAKENWAVAVGHRTVANKLSAAIGQSAKAEGNRSNAFGYNSSASGKSSIAFGDDSQGTANYSTALGHQAKALGEKSTAVGAFSNASGEGSLSFGSGVHTTGNNSFSMGRNIKNNGTKTVAIGNNIDVTTDNSVFLGDGSRYTAQSETSGGIGKVDGNYAGADAKGVVSVGNKGNERRIQNVAAGLLSHQSTDAVNGSQLHATNQRLEEVNKDAKAGIAAAMAFKDVPFVPGKWSYAAGAAHYSSESAVSLNLGRTSNDGKWAVSGGMSSDSRGRLGFRVGVSGVFN